MINLDDPYFSIRKAFNTQWPGPRGKKIHLRNEYIQLDIYPEDGCRILDLFVHGYSVLRPWQTDRFAFQYGCFPMLPWVGRLKNATLKYNHIDYVLPANKIPHALHGMACFAPWKCLCAEQTKAELLFILEHPWPWKGKVIYTIELIKSEIQLSLSIYTEQDSFPAAAGWHPWFNKSLLNTTQVLNNDHLLKINFNADWQRKTGSDELPKLQKTAPQEGPWDDCFGFKHPLNVSLTWPNQLQLDISSSENHLVIFDKQPDATCVNPMSEAPNDINQLPLIVDKNNPLNITTNWKFSLLN